MIHGWPPGAKKTERPKHGWEGKRKEKFENGPMHDDKVDRRAVGGIFPEVAKNEEPSGRRTEQGLEFGK
jgi:hypothetical protein